MTSRALFHLTLILGLSHFETAMALSKNAASLSAPTQAQNPKESTQNGAEINSSRQILDSAPAGSNASNSWSNQWKISLGNKESNSETSRSQVFETKFDFSTRYHLLPFLDLAATPVLKYQTGQVQGSDREQKPESKIYFREVFAQMQTNFRVQAKLGALNQSNRHHPFFIGDNAFPGAELSWFAQKNSVSQIELSASSVMPTTSSSNGNPNDLEGTPNLSSVQMEWKYLGKLSPTLAIGYFQFSDLPTSFSNAAFLNGNTTSSTQLGINRFDYEFKGFESNISLQYEITRKWSIESHNFFVNNTAAPTGMNQAWHSSLGSSYQLTPAYSLSIYGGKFRIESDATIAGVNSYTYQGTNRNGYWFGGEFGFTKAKARIRGEYSETDVIFENPYQSKTRSLTIKLETDYAPI